MDKEPLVSVVVMTYNSSKTIIDTLESIKSQTYSNIELVVTDDCSTDDTVFVVKHWIEENSSFFKNAVLVSTPHNRGVSGNVNNGIRNSNGEWVKSIAGDDLCLPTCIADNVRYITENPEINILYSLSKSFRVVNGEKIIEADIREGEWAKWNEHSVEEKLRVYVDHCALSSPTVFIRRKFALSNPYDEDIPFLDDWTFMFALLCKGIDLPLMQKVTVLYSIGDGSLIHQKSIIYSERMDMSERLFWYKYRMWELRDENAELYDYMMKYFLLHDIQDGLFHNRPSFIRKVLNRCVYYFVMHVFHFDIKRTMITVKTRQ